MYRHGCIKENCLFFYPWDEDSPRCMSGVLSCQGPYSTLSECRAETQFWTWKCSFSWKWAQNNHFHSNLCSETSVSALIEEMDKDCIEFFLSASELKCLSKPSKENKAVCRPSFHVKDLTLRTMTTIALNCLSASELKSLSKASLRRTKGVRMLTSLAERVAGRAVPPPEKRKHFITVFI